MQMCGCRKRVLVSTDLDHRYAVAVEGYPVVAEGYPVVAEG